VITFNLFGRAANGVGVVFLGANERVWNRVEEVVDLDVIVEVDSGAPPFRELPVLDR